MAYPDEVRAYIWDRLRECEALGVARELTFDPTLSSSLRTSVDCLVCGDNRRPLLERICSACWLASVAPGGDNVDLPFTLMGPDGSTAFVRLGDVVATHPGFLTAEEIAALYYLELGASLTVSTDRAGGPLRLVRAEYPETPR